MIYRIYGLHHFTSKKAIKMFVSPKETLMAKMILSKYRIFLFVG